jgi:hypothetical protein
VVDLIIAQCENVKLTKELISAENNANSWQNDLEQAGKLQQNAVKSTFRRLV